ncbi:MAG TPA: DUF1883 domain-containing protein [Cryomorphaceae bacterium]|nr:DUF1883 domain-containing protein [Cryomorphaceae bacterium]
MKFLHKPFLAKSKDVIEVSFDKPTKVLLLESSQFSRYKKGQTYQYRGGKAERSPVSFVVPFDATWHAVIEKGSFNHPLDVTGNAVLIPHRYDTLNGSEQTGTEKRSVEEYDDTLD